MRKILIFRTGGIGDFILSTLAMQVLQASEEEFDVVWAGRSPGLELIERFYPEARTYELSRNKNNFQLYSGLKKIMPEPDLILDLQRSPRTLFISVLFKLRINGPYYVSWNKRSISRTLMVLKQRFKNRNSGVQNNIKPLPSRVECMSKACIRGMNKLGLAIQDKQYLPGLTERKGSKNKAAVCLGSLYPLKNLPLDYQAAFIRHCLDELGIEKIILLGDAKSSENAVRLLEMFPLDKIENMVGNTSLPEAANILSDCKFSLANDSALAHLSESVGTPVMMFFGPTHESLGYRPYLKDSLAFSSSIACRPCHKSGNTDCRFGDDLCKKNLPVQNVFDHLLNLKNV